MMVVRDFTKQRSNFPYFVNLQPASHNFLVRKPSSFLLTPSFPQGFDGYNYLRPDIAPRPSLLGMRPSIIPFLTDKLDTTQQEEAFYTVLIEKGRNDYGFCRRVPRS